MLRQSTTLGSKRMVLTDATLLATGVTAEGMLATEPGRERALLEGVHDSVRWAEELLEDNPHA
jgi:hypothetical protein